MISTIHGAVGLCLLLSIGRSTAQSYWSLPVSVSNYDAFGLNGGGPIDFSGSDMLHIKVRVASGSADVQLRIDLNEGGVSTSAIPVVLEVGTTWVDVTVNYDGKWGHWDGNGSVNPANVDSLTFFGNAGGSWAGTIELADLSHSGVDLTAGRIFWGLSGEATYIEEPGTPLIRCAHI
jgi:hypothetical protein